MALAGVHKLSEGRMAEARRTQFGRALAEALRVRGWNQADLAERMHTTQSAVSAWITGKSQPAADDVFEVELEMDMGPGSLSRHLGYRPIDPEESLPDTESCITADPTLTADYKDIVLAVYRGLKIKASERAVASSNGARPARKTATPPSRSSRQAPQ